METDIAPPSRSSRSLSDLVLPHGSAPDALHACKILIIDDEPTNVRLLERVLLRSGFLNFTSTTDPQTVSDLFIAFQPDLVLTDLLMPEVDGCQVIEQLRALIGTDDFLPIVVLTADSTHQAKKRALSCGATDFLTKPFDQIEVVLRIRNLLHTRLTHLIIQTQNATLEESVRQRTLELECSFEELRQSQQQVIQQERLAALGTMAGGIAHDFNNALSVIIGFSEILLRDPKESVTREEITPPLTTILTAAEDAAKIVHRLREFYRPGEAGEQRLPVNLNDLIGQAVSLTQPRWQTAAASCGQEIIVHTELGETPKVLGDSTELREVLTNLIFNAVDALPKGGTIKLSTHCDDKMVALRISDTGTGMSEDVRKHCLEPFFTTKGQDGTGLGLSMVFGIVQRHGGKIKIESKLGHGTTFALLFPSACEEKEAAANILDASIEPLRILVVDDQEVLCQLLCELLQDDRHTVETATSGIEALNKFRASTFDLVITDHVMTGMTGENLAVKLKCIDPDLPVILLTGYADVGTSNLSNDDAIDLVLGKPLTSAALRAGLAKVMAHRSLISSPLRAERV